MPIKYKPKKNTFLFLAVIFIVGAIFVIQIKQVEAANVDVNADVCLGSPLAGVTVTLRSGTTTVGNSCMTNASEGCVITFPNPAADTTYDISVAPPSGYVAITPTTATSSCPSATTLTVSSTGGNPGIIVYLTPAITGTTPGTYGLTNKPLKNIINGITEWLLGIAAGLTILYLVWGGIYYVTASGDESQIEDAKRIIKYALIGLFVIGISYGIVVAMDKLIK